MMTFWKKKKQREIMFQKVKTADEFAEAIDPEIPYFF